MEKEIKHGTMYAYDYDKCRCQPCRTANTAKSTANRLKRMAVPKDPNDPRHGTRNFYFNHGCRCVPCSEAGIGAVTQRRGPVIERPYEVRFWEKVDKTPTCWNWTASKNTGGYGMLQASGDYSPTAHRASYEMAKGPIPKGMEIDHMCHNRACVNPDHLRAVTSKQNSENYSGPQKNSKSGVLGVHRDSSGTRWRAQVMHNGKIHSVGTYGTIEEASAAIVAKRNELFTHNDLDRRAA